MNKDQEINSLKLEIGLLKQDNDRLYNGLWKRFDNFIDKEKIINYLENEFLELLKDDISNEIKINISNWKMKLIMKLQEKIKNGEFD